MNGLGQRVAVSAALGAAVLAGCVAAAPASAAQPGSASPAGLLDLSFQVININSRKCLTVVGGAVTDNAGLRQQTCSPEPAFRWRLVPASFTGVFLIQNVRSGKCLTIADTDDFAVQKTCDRAPARHWQLRKSPGVPDNVPNSDAQLVNARSEKCLTLAGNGLTENARALQSSCGPGRSHRWTVRVVAGPLVTLPGT